MSEDLARWKKRLSEVGQLIKCPIWMTGDGEQGFHGPDARVIGDPSQTYCLYDSPRAGGVFRLEPYSFDRSADGDTRIKISRWVYDKNQLGEIGYLTSDEIERIKKQERLRIEQRMDRLLRCFAHLPSHVARGLRYAGSYPNHYEFQVIEAATECSTEDFSEISDEDLKQFMKEEILEDQEVSPELSGEMNLSQELDWLVSAVVESGWIEKHNSHIRLTPAGMKRLEELETKAVNSEQAFVVMWFDESVNEAYEKGIEPAIKDSGYRPLRIDKKEFNDKIDDEIIAEIRRSRFVVCDFTCGLIAHKDEQIAISRGGVYYEAGFAQGLGIQVIWTCHADLIKHVHFDTRQFNHITWNTPEELRKKLRNRIGAVIGDGPLKGR